MSQTRRALVGSVMRGTGADVPTVGARRASRGLIGRLSSGRVVRLAIGSAIGLAMGLGSVPTLADEPTADGSGGGSGSEIRFTPYAWLTGYSGTAASRGAEFDVDLSFGDVLDESDTVVGLMGALDLRVERLVFQLNGAYAEAEQTNERAVIRPGGSGTATVDAEFSNAWIEFLAGYRFVERGWGEGHGAWVDGFAGVRHTSLDLDVTLNAVLDVTLPDGTAISAGGSRGLDSDEDWFEPFVGARGAIVLASGWTFSLRGDVGGFDVDDSRLALQVVAAVGREWRIKSGTLGLFAGYRALYQDYANDGFEWDVLTHGPLLGGTIRFDF